MVDNSYCATTIVVSMFWVVYSTEMSAEATLLKVEVLCDDYRPKGR